MKKKPRNWDYGNYYVNPKLLAKAIRFISKDWVYDKNIDFKNQEAIGWIWIDEFHMALHLDRAIEVGESVANKYVDILKKYGLIPKDLINYEEVVKHLNQLLCDFIFKNYNPEIEKRGDGFYRTCQEIEDGLSKRN